jgi:hypothetical protein
VKRVHVRLESKITDPQIGVVQAEEPMADIVFTDHLRCSVGISLVCGKKKINCNIHGHDMLGPVLA